MYTGCVVDDKVITVAMKHDPEKANLKDHFCLIFYDGNTILIL